MHCVEGHSVKGHCVIRHCVKGHCVKGHCVAEERNPGAGDTGWVLWLRWAHILRANPEQNLASSSPYVVLTLSSF
eukprot:1159584-Pelagomonas_calceolata.AAC.14